MIGTSTEWLRLPPNKGPPFCLAKPASCCPAETRTGIPSPHTAHTYSKWTLTLRKWSGITTPLSKEQHLDRECRKTSLHCRKPAMDMGPCFGRKHRKRPLYGNSVSLVFICIYGYFSINRDRFTWQKSPQKGKPSGISLGIDLAELFPTNSKRTLLVVTQCTPAIGLWKVHKLTPWPLIKPSTTQRLLLVFLILLQAGDLELNLGPKTGHDDTDFPCGLCDMNVDWSHNALQCDGCDIWLHAACMDMSSHNYRQLGETSSLWICCRCGLRNINSSLFWSHTPSHDDNSDLHTTSNTSTLSSAAGSPGPPKLASTQSRTFTPTTRHRRPGLVIVNVNW